MNAISLKGVLKYDFGAKKVYSRIIYKPYKTILNVFFNISDEKYKELEDSEAYFRNNSDVFTVEKISKNRAHIYCVYTNFC